MFNFVYPSRFRDHYALEAPDLTREQVIADLRKYINRTLTGAIDPDDIYIVAWTMSDIKRGTYTKEDFALTDEHMSRLEAFLAEYDARRKRIDEIRQLYQALRLESDKLYFFRQRKKQEVLKAKAAELLEELISAGLNYRDCGIDGSFVGKFLKS